MHCLPRAAGLILLAGLLLQACQSSRDTTVMRSAFVFATRLDVTVRHADTRLANAAIDRILESARQMHETFHPWKTGELQHLNTAIRQKALPFKVSRAMENVIAMCTGFQEASNRLFNPALGRLFAMWGFHSNRPDASSAQTQGLEAYLANLPTMDSVKIRNGSVTAAHENVQFDFSGMLKGYSLDVARGILAEAGIENALLSYGSVVAAFGHAEDSQPWRVGIRLAADSEIIGTVTLMPGETLSISGTTERNYTGADGETVHHILDPETGRPSKQARLAAVICSQACGTNSSAAADALSTALAIASPEEAAGIAERFGSVAHLAVRDNNDIKVGGKAGERFRLF